MDVLRIRDWYRTPQGRVVRRVLRGPVQGLLPNGDDSHVLGLGYTLPYLREQEENRNCFTAMPGKMGVTHWPENMPNRSLLCWEDQLPFPDNTFDYIFVAHALEFTGSPEVLLESCWRVLRPEGRLLVMVPNRAGLWSHRETTPLGRGHPYSSHELHKLLRHGNFMMTQSFYALHVPPTNRRWLLQTYETWEKAGTRWWAPTGGVLFMEGRKDVYGMRAVRSAKPHPKPVTVKPAAAWDY